NVALHSEEESDISFFIRKDIGSPSASTKSSRGGETELSVTTEKLSTYLKRFKDVDLVKMDVEGSEVEILEDLINSSTIKIPKEYFIEFHHNINQDKSALSSFLKPFEENGFTYNIRSKFRSG